MSERLRWRGLHLAKVTPRTRVIGATIDGAPAYAVVSGEIREVSYDRDKEPGWRLEAA